MLVVDKTKDDIIGVNKVLQKFQSLESGILVTVYNKQVSLVVTYNSDIPTNKATIAALPITESTLKYGHHTASIDLQEFINRHLKEELEQKLHYFNTLQDFAKAIIENDWR